MLLLVRLEAQTQQSFLLLPLVASITLPTINLKTGLYLHHHLRFSKPTVVSAVQLNVAGRYLPKAVDIGESARCLHKLKANVSADNTGIVSTTNDTSAQYQIARPSLSVSRKISLGINERSIQVPSILTRPFGVQSTGVVLPSSAKTTWTDTSRTRTYTWIETLSDLGFVN